MASVVFLSKRSGARREPVLFTVVNGPRLTRAISRRCAIARRAAAELYCVLMLQGTRFSRAPCSRTSGRVPFRGAARVYRHSFRMVSSQAVRQNEKNA